ncbi:MAG: YcaO-like family protein [Candidatus Kaiserbacteria bacterium]|nr:YcaO-like family protein [Candidatus Kaiserbacteria bacterium]
MLKDVLPFDRVWLNSQNPSLTAKAISSFVHFLEQRLGAEFVYDHATIRNESLDLVKILELAEILRSRGVIRSYARVPRLSDEPNIASWRAEYVIEGGKREGAGGSALDNDSLALTKTLAEAIERNIWFTHSDFSPSRRATLSEIEREDFLHPESFVSYNDLERKNNPRLALKPSDSFHWVKGYSWTKEKSSWVPAQIISGHSALRAFSHSGALEVIERDAYMITWLNQLSPPRIDLTELSLQSESLTLLLERCRQYRFVPHAIHLPTDAPAHVVCIMLEDSTGTLPHFAVGLKAHKNPSLAVEGALLEALRMHQSARKQKLSPETTWDPSTKASEVTHNNRLLYWAEPNRGDKLSFLIQGDIQPFTKEMWESDTDEEHFARIVKWCQKQNYDLVSVDFSDAPANIPKWSIEFVVIPQLQPLYFSEKLPCIGGKRLQDIPEQFGYPSRKPYTDEPHPFV